MGKPFSSVYQTSSSQRCRGQVTKVERELLEGGDKGALRIYGSATDRVVRNAAAEVSDGLG